MTKIEQLLIRATKEKNHHERLKRTICRFYEAYSNVLAITLLSELIDEVLPMRIGKFVGQIQARTGYQFWNETRDEAMLEVLINRLRFSDPKDLQGYIIPAKWRSK